MDGFEVLTGELDTHAGKVDGLTDRLRRGRLGLRYGLPAVRGDAAAVEEFGVRTLQQGADALADTASKVRDTARSYTTADIGEAAQYRGMEGAL